MRHKARRLALLTALAVVGPLPLLGCQSERSAEEYVLKAKGHVEKDDYQAAFIELSNALQKDPSTREARRLMAEVALELGDGARAEKEARRAMELGLPRAEIQTTLARAVLLQGDADRLLEETATWHPDTPKTDVALLLALRGHAHLLKGNGGQASSNLEQALKVDPESMTALVGMSLLNVSRREFQEARRWTERALETGPESAQAWSALGELEMAEGKPAEAEVAFGKAIKHARYAGLDRVKRAFARVRLGKLDEAHSDIRVLMRQGFKNDPHVNYVAGLAFFAQGETAKAASSFEASYAAQPSFLPARMYLATTRHLLGETEQALNHAQYVYANAPRSQAAKRVLGAIQMSRSDFTAARSVLESALASAPQDPGTLRMLAAVSLLEGDGMKGLEYSSRLASLEPQSQEVQEMVMVAKLVAGEAFGAELAGEPREGEEAYKREFLFALDAFRNNKPQEALERATRLHQKHPDRVDPLNLMSAARLAMGEWDLAKIELEKVLALKPNEPSAARNLAKIEAQAGNLERARALLRGLVKERPDDEDAAMLLAEAEARIDGRAASVQALEEILKRSPDSLTVRARLAGEHLAAGNVARVLALTDALSGPQVRKQPTLLELRGKAQMLSGDVTAARLTFEEWTNAAPNSAQAHYFHADSLARSGDALRARHALERAVRLDGKYLPARVAEVRLLVESGEIDQARRLLAGLRQDFGDHPEVDVMEGWFALGTGDFPTAERRFAAALEQRPDSEMTILLSRALWSQKKHDEALRVVRDWLETKPEDTAALLHLGNTYMALGRHAEARASYERVIELRPESVPALNNLAWLHREKDLARAIEYAERAHKLAPEDPYVLDTLGMLAFEKGDVERAYKLVSDAAGRFPEHVQIRLHLGSILVRQERLGEARELLGSIVKEGPDTEAAREAKALLESIGAAAR